MSQRLFSPHKVDYYMDHRPLLCLPVQAVPKARLLPFSRIFHPDLYGSWTFRAAQSKFCRFGRINRLFLETQGSGSRHTHKTQSIGGISHYSQVVD